MNSTVNASLGYAPFEIVYGRRLRFPLTPHTQDCNGPLVVHALCSDHLVTLSDPKTNTVNKQPVHLNRVKIAYVREPTPSSYFVSNITTKKVTSYKTKATQTDLSNSVESNTNKPTSESTKLVPQRPKRNVQPPHRYRNDNILFEFTESSGSDNQFYKVRKVLAQRVIHATPKVAFFANGLADGNKLTVNQILKYTKVGVNTGNCYHASTGVFTCTVAGTYAFFYNQYTALVKDGVPINYCACDGRPSHYSSCGITTIVHYNVGDSIWVRVQASTSQNAFAGEDSFSGFLLYQD
ncbi:hypothetical protein KUTeg_014918 [Tegillarca granosa]|uniref:C1q domain-containing protein n=1 Tax=Tegillarca granosa TaxID=220873 RepID=A0ABQ9ENP5_TEGGR|nr:hypothetical protein KUTeg_014918 [Tegillarca granosa]